MVTKEQFFAEKGFFSRTSLPVSTLEDAVLALGNGTSIVLPSFLPSSVYSQRLAALKFGKKVSLNENKLPRQQFSDIPQLCSGYSWLQHGKRNLATLDQCIQGAKLFAYAEIHDLIDVQVYNKDVQVTLPSRTPKEDRYSVVLRDVPITDASRWSYMHTTHDCETTRFILGPGDLHLFCAHEVAAYLAFTKHVLERNKQDISPEQKQRNRAALFGNPFVVPSQAMVSFYSQLQTHIGIKGTRRRHLNMAEKEPLLWMYAERTGDLWKKENKLLREFDW